ncbi:MAG: class I SAM-dependent methyltransferase [Candidatus Omnitrophica bacterium]|nr:class I SAM-dependent methyltransferase [Candidatus Omnitrophota bacterium]
MKLDVGALPFKEEYFEFWFKRENSHFWHIARKEIIYQFAEPFLRHFSPFRDFLGIEIGVGNGNVAQQFVRHDIPMEGADLFLSSLQFCRKRLDVPLYQADLLKLPFKDRYDFVGIYDILEHIEDDGLAIANLYRALKPGGVLNVTVPACKFLWSQFDELDHKRRYSKRELVSKLKEVGFKIRRVSFFMFLLFPVVYLIRKIQRYPKDTKLEHVKEVRVIPVVNEILLFLFRFEKILLGITNLPIGSSLIVIAEKPNVTEPRD